MASSTADCKETNRKSRRRLGDALEGLGMRAVWSPQRLRETQLLHGATPLAFVGSQMHYGAADPQSPAYLLNTYKLIYAEPYKCMHIDSACLCKYLDLSLSFGGENASMTYSCRQTNVKWGALGVLGVMPNESIR